MKRKREFIEISVCQLSFTRKQTAHLGAPDFLFCCYYRNGRPKTNPTSYQKGNKEEILWEAGTPEGHTLSAKVNQT